MFARVYPRQEHSQVVSLGDWQPHDDFYPFAPGTKPKGLIWCPEVSDAPFLLAGHLYMFKSGDDWRARQFWSEVIAYEISKLCGVHVPPAFVAIGPDNQTTGCLLELFLGYKDEPSEVRLVHGSDLLSRVTPNYDDKSGRPHTFTGNVRICRGSGVKDTMKNWAALIAFDALIGNTDRHPENWGLLRHLDGEASKLVFAPLYDNGTSLGYNVREGDLARESTPERLARFVNRGTHHVQLAVPDKQGAGHISLCKTFADEYPGAREVMLRVMDFDPAGIGEILDWCVGFEIEPRFTVERAAFVGQLLESRRRAILAALEG